MKAPLLFLPSLALVALGDTALQHLADGASMVKLRQTSTTPLRDVFHVVADARILPFEQPETLAGRVGLQKRQFSGLTTKLDTTFMCGAFQQLPYTKPQTAEQQVTANESSAALSFNTGAALFKVPKLYRRTIPGNNATVNGTTDQILAMSVDVDSVWCLGISIGIVAGISPDGTQRNYAFFELPGADSVIVDSIDINTGDTVAAGVHTRTDGSARLLIVNRSTDQGGEDDFQVSPNCGQTVSWMVKDVVTLSEDHGDERPTLAHGDYFPDFEPIRFRYMDANRTDGASSHLNGSTFAGLVFSANNSATLKPLCRGAMSTNVTNELRITSYKEGVSIV